MVMKGTAMGRQPRGGITCEGESDPQCGERRQRLRKTWDEEQSSCSDGLSKVQEEAATLSMVMGEKCWASQAERRCQSEEEGNSYQTLKSEDNGGYPES